MPKQVALIKGDGVGPELVDAMMLTINAVGADVKTVTCNAGSEWWEANGGDSYIPPETWKILEESDACYKGPTTTIPKPDGPKSVAVSIRQHFDLYANIRPIKTFPNMVGPLGEVDFVCVREATEGMYSGIEYRLTDDVAIAIRKTTRNSCKRIVRRAFEIAKERAWKKVIAVSKANILKITDGVFLDAGREVSKEFSGIELEDYYIDNFCQQLVKNPQRFNQNVVVSTNLFMDIISEEASGLIGSIGVVYSGNFGEKYAMFEPAHGSAPKYKGLDKVNPTATILSGAWMLEYLGDRARSQAIFKATEQVISEGKVLTYDMKGQASTSEMAKTIAEKAKKLLRR